MMPDRPLHIILTPVGSAGDVHPYIGIGSALRERGHDVTLIAAAPFRERVEKAGLQFRALGSAEEYERVTADPDLWHPTRGPKLVLGITAKWTRDQYEQIESVYDPGRSVVVGHTISFGTRVFEDRHDAPAATIHLAPIALRSEYEAPAPFPGRDLSNWPRWIKRTAWWLVDRCIIDPVIAEEINAFRRSLDLPPVRRPMHEWIHSPKRVIGLFPEWFARAQPDWPDAFTQTGFVFWDAGNQREVDRDLEQFLNAGAAPILFTFGSANEHVRELLDAALGAVMKLNRRAIFISPNEAQAPTPPPESVFVAGYAPFGRVLPRCAAIVHHGGVGTSAQAIRAGIPQLICPLSHDQPDNATRLQRLGLARILVPKRFTANRMAADLDRLLNSASTANACLRLQERQRSDPGIDRTLALIESCADGPSRPGA